MRIRDRINADIILAMKAQDPPRLSALRMMKSAVKLKEVDAGAELEDGQAIQVLSSMIKQRRDAIEMFGKGGRTDLVEKETAEIRVNLMGSQMRGNLGWIEVICGSMFSGKSEELIRRLRRAQIARQRVQIFKPRIDTAYTKDHIVSHSDQKIASEVVGQRSGDPGAPGPAHGGRWDRRGAVLRPRDRRRLQPPGRHGRNVSS